jgi:hypothetical protein
MVFPKCCRVIAADSRASFPKPASDSGSSSAAMRRCVVERKRVAEKSGKADIERTNCLPRLRNFANPALRKHGIWN